MFLLTFLTSWPILRLAPYHAPVAVMAATATVKMTVLGFEAEGIVNSIFCLFDDQMAMYCGY
jgi:hypothetical protein